MVIQEDGTKSDGTVPSQWTRGKPFWIRIAWLKLGGYLKLASVARSRTDWLLERRLLGESRRLDVEEEEKRERERGPCYSWRFTNLEMRKPFGFQLSVSALCFLQPLIKEENLISWLRTTGNIYTWVNHFDPSFLSNIKILFDPLRILRVISYFYCIVTNI